ncbi:dual specificity phosphatase 1 [Thecamonas trahens ATCC 50062]|uniref:protein-tyrosine-phosphatase n=1 Tax=Thecamonas trahens ATCC 50062 TaxID=461836 RepID=A0A0L0DNB9_THETB|nr:dual specificity phosphatase 1 [Thecamonas trahens ATCC 50062]KNC53807.1 dual specificity phosphatase 1 [Thecamonas trahens ATCC 50062]|eukprot:XP_013754365.1 dual specificity phosphatase 1 [Thecamonas trahens ATCC 50062]
MAAGYSSAALRQTAARTAANDWALAHEAPLAVAVVGTPEEQEEEESGSGLDSSSSSTPLSTSSPLSSLQSAKQSVPSQPSVRATASDIPLGTLSLPSPKTPRARVGSSSGGSVSSRASTRRSSDTPDSSTSMLSSAQPSRSSRTYSGSASDSESSLGYSGASQLRTSRTGSGLRSRTSSSSSSPPPTSDSRSRSRSPGTNRRQTPRLGHYTSKSLMELPVSARKPPRMTKLPPALGLDLSAVGKTRSSMTATAQARKSIETAASNLTQLFPYLYIGGLSSASNKQALVHAGITHVINCAYAPPPETAPPPGDVPDVSPVTTPMAVSAPNFASQETKAKLEAVSRLMTFTYTNVVLADILHADILAVLYEIMEIIDSVRRAGGAVFIHCRLGISRSVALSVAWVMLLNDWDYAKALAWVQTKRPIARPNVGFTFVLQDWYERCHRPKKALADAGPRNTQVLVYAIEPQSTKPGASPFLVARIVPHTDPRLFAVNASSAFILHGADNKLYTYCGHETPSDYRAAIRKAVLRLQLYEGAGDRVKVPANAPHIFANLLVDSGVKPQTPWAKFDEPSTRESHLLTLASGGSVASAGANTSSDLHESNSSSHSFAVSAGTSAASTDNLAANPVVSTAAWLLSPSRRADGAVTNSGSSCASSESGSGRTSPTPSPGMYSSTDAKALAALPEAHVIDVHMLSKPRKASIATSSLSSVHAPFSAPLAWNPGRLANVSLAVPAPNATVKTKAVVRRALTSDHLEASHQTVLPVPLRMPPPTSELRLAVQFLLVQRFRSDRPKAAVASMLDLVMGSEPTSILAHLHVTSTEQALSAEWRDAHGVRGVVRASRAASTQPGPDLLNTPRDGVDTPTLLQLPLVDEVSTDLALVAIDFMEFVASVASHGGKVAVYASSGETQALALAVWWVATLLNISYHDALALVMLKRGALIGGSGAASAVSPHFQSQARAWHEARLAAFGHSLDVAHARSILAASMSESSPNSARLRREHSTVTTSSTGDYAVAQLTDMTSDSPNDTQADLRLPIAMSATRSFKSGTVGSSSERSDSSAAAGPDELTGYSAPRTAQIVSERRTRVYAIQELCPGASASLPVARELDVAKHASLFSLDVETSAQCLLIHDTSNSLHLFAGRMAPPTHVAKLREHVRRLQCWFNAGLLLNAVDGTKSSQRRSIGRRDQSKFMAALVLAGVVPTNPWSSPSRAGGSGELSTEAAAVLVENRMGRRVSVSGSLLPADTRPPAVIRVPRESSPKSLGMSSDESMSRAPESIQGADSRSTPWNTEPVVSTTDSSQLTRHSSAAAVHPADATTVAVAAARNAAHPPPQNSRSRGCCCVIS